MSVDWISKLREIVVESLERSWLPFPVEGDICEGWKRGLEVGGGRSTVLYTSCMYHLAPVVEKAVEALEKYGAARGGVRSSLAAFAARAFGGLLLKPEREEVERADAVVRKIYGLLRRSGVEFGLLDREVYSGALLYELGLVDDFAAYAKKVAQYFRERGVRRVITVDPHTHHLLEKVYPQYVDFDVEVVSYIDLVKPVGVTQRGFAIHDSCLYARFLGRYDAVRKLLAAGEPVEDPYVTGRETAQCCGGPIESLFPEVARKIAEARVRDLSRLSNKVVVQCPICYINLRRASGGRIELYHLAEVLE
ncbi:(Fe-S)-binding protein [Pyrobaculum neutrophilum]|uniref:Cysteine-rich domain-containing protein n=1 Tax=Pyrobaculum neutrophilum (strain DSM 2338 / JCM 9278 / NBRC 100436 / V24Sta) TaxID=444157 RepID=B1YBE4_PYRNV|nr:(Fe-S)-binding protein [Pyrobaculum neutrophilum]ACB39275.1 protein of unknown function DUF224 cysteine-rich region domain protein [Pyrobaculum neutrophilum V24Sta]